MHCLPWSIDYKYRLLSGTLEAQFITRLMVLQLHQQFVCSQQVFLSCYGLKPKLVALKMHLKNDNTIFSPLPRGHRTVCQYSPPAW